MTRIEDQFGKTFGSAPDDYGNGNSGSNNNNGNNENVNRKNNNRKNDDDKNKKNKKPKIKTYTAYKYSTDVTLAEEIQLGNENRNKFLQIKEGIPKISSEIDLRQTRGIIINPHQKSEATPIIPYAFKDEDEIRHFIGLARQETIHSLFFKSKSLLMNFVVAKDSDTINLLAIDEVYSYFQDLFPTTHYDMVTGSPGSGKNAILFTMKMSAYRAILGSNMSGANLLDIFGSVEPGQVIVLEDEFDDLDKDEMKRKIIKVGYDQEGTVPRTLDGNTSDRHSNWYFVYGLKIFAAENPLESKYLGGFIDRIFRIESIKSSPKFHIKTILKESRKPVDKQNPKYREIISQMVNLRKILLIYRILHHEDIIEEVPLNIDGRSWELTSPQIFLFASDKLTHFPHDKPALPVVLKTLSRFLQKKGQLTKKILDAIVHETVENELFSDSNRTITRTVIDVSGRCTTVCSISNEDICEAVRIKVDGIPSTTPNEQAFYSTDYSKVTHKRILKICRERLMAEPDSIGTGKEKVRALTFDKDTVEKIGKTFEVISEIKIVQDWRQW